MKQRFSLLLVFILIFTLCACGSKKNTDKSAPSLEISDSGNKGPGQDIIQQDLQKELAVIPNMKLNSASVIKSLTEDNHYKATLQIDAETVYADWKLQCDISYTKYDQGWIMDEIDWEQKNVNQKRYPNESEIIEYALIVLANHEEYANTYYSDYILPMYEPVVEIIEQPELKAIKISWEAREHKIHSYISHLFSTYWIYEPSIDNWLLIEDVEPENEEYNLSFERLGIIPGNYNFAGEWTQELTEFEEKIGIVNRIIIRNFSWERLEAYIPDLETYLEIDPHFVFVGEEYGVLKFENSFEQSINFQFGNEWTNVYFCIPGYDIAQATARIYDDLPLLT